ncbi:epimerase [Bradyrhizobium macuxiense]|uniref:Epimerase n=1 Tax=Bradyrhizobium macuxiense TaxID=1755647 RepID=A0A109K2E6_9BRAD|nr:NAD-dependent epimerase/dehydratase family protein [Bradyrhizobium macuxiense]KWV59544.1 epimerase [Bradyrhizobium macuxiense]
MVNGREANGQALNLVIGGSGLVGGYIVEHLANRGGPVLAMSRSPRKGRVEWIQGDLRQPDALNLPQFTTLYCTTDAILLAEALPFILGPSVKRVVVFSSTSVLTKRDTEIADERETIRKLVTAEEAIAAACERHQIAWTILRPTLIYAEGRDTNITPLSRLIRRFGFMPIVGGARGFRQPVHAEDLAIAAIAAAERTIAANKFYSLPGPETLTYREMMGRVFDGMGLPRRLIYVPPWLWRAGFRLAKPLFPGANVAMGIRMMKDMTFDCRPAVQDLGWQPRDFHPAFDSVSPQQNGQVARHP